MFRTEPMRFRLAINSGSIYWHDAQRQPRNPKLKHCGNTLYNSMTANPTERFTPFLVFVVYFPSFCCGHHHSTLDYISLMIQVSCFEDLHYSTPALIIFFWIAGAFYALPPLHPVPGDSSTPISSWSMPSFLLGPWKSTTPAFLLHSRIL